jgi:hypothetical protein
MGQSGASECSGWSVDQEVEVAATRKQTLDLIYRATTQDAVRYAQEARSEYLVAHPDDEEIAEMGEILVIRSRALQHIGHETRFAEDIARALEALPRNLRAVVALVDVGGSTYREASDALGIPLGTVGSRLSRAHMLLWAMLGKDQYDVERGDALRQRWAGVSMANGQAFVEALRTLRTAIGLATKDNDAVHDRTGSSPGRVA